MNFRTIIYSRLGATVYLTLNRPRASNQINVAMAQEIHLACQALQQEEGVRVVVLTGKGAVFCAGGDIPSLSRSAKHGYTSRQWLELHRPASSLAKLPLPTIAAINGDAIDQGLELALACDLRIAAHNTRLGLTQLRRGVIPWDGGTQRLPRLIGRAPALEMLLGAQVMKAKEASVLGLINTSVSHDSLMVTVDKLCSTIASVGPIAAKYTKEAILGGMDLSLDQGLALEADLNLILQSTADRAEGIKSFLNKRLPNFMDK